MKYITLILCCIVELFKLNNSCYAYAISYNICSYCIMLNKHYPVSLRKNNILNAYDIRRNIDKNMVSHTRPMSKLNDFYQMDYAYIPYPFDIPNVTKIANVTNTTNTTDTTDTTDTTYKYMNNRIVKYALGAFIIVIDKFYSYYNIL